MDPPGPSGEPLATLEGVAMRYGARTALQGLSLEVRRGEVLGLVGPNGAGKTTALRILCGLLEPTLGQARVAGHDLQREPLAARRELGFVPEGAPLYANLSPLEHLQVVGRLHGLAGADLEAAARRLLASLDLGERAGDPVGSFSRGMRQKAALACALLPRPPLLVLDEPLAGLDAPTAGVVKALLRAWAGRGGGVLYTSHLLEVVERVCDRIAILAEGRLKAVGSLAQLRTFAGEGGDLEELFRHLTRAPDPQAQALRILGEGPRVSGSPEATGA